MSARLFVASKPFILQLQSPVSSAEVEQGPAHDRIRIWNRGGLAGELVVTSGDGERIAKQLGLEEQT